MPHSPPTPHPSLPHGEIGSGNHDSRPSPLESYATVTPLSSISADQVASSFRRSGPSVTLDTLPGYDRELMRAKQQKAARRNGVNNRDGDMATKGIEYGAPGPCTSRIGTLVAKRKEKEASRTILSRPISTEEGRTRFAKRQIRPSIPTSSALHYASPTIETAASEQESQGPPSLPADETHRPDPVGAWLDDDLFADQAVFSTFSKRHPYLKTLSGTIRGTSFRCGHSEHRRASQLVGYMSGRVPGMEKGTSDMLERGAKLESRIPRDDYNWYAGEGEVGEYW